MHSQEREHAVFRDQMPSQRLSVQELKSIVPLATTANCEVAVSVHLAYEHASCAEDWRLFCPESWNDQALAGPVAAAGAARRRQRAGIPGEVRRREKWRLALEHDR